MLKNIEYHELHKYFLLATDKFAYKEIVKIILETIKYQNRKITDSTTSFEIPNFFKKNSEQKKYCEVIKLLFQNPYFPDEDKFNLLSKIKKNYDKFKIQIDRKSDSEYFQDVFDFTNSVFFNDIQMLKKYENELFQFNKERSKWIFLGLDEQNKQDKIFFQFIDQIEKLVLFKDYSKEKQLPEIDEKIRLNINNLISFLSKNENYINKFPMTFFKFLSSNWIKDLEIFNKESIKNDILKLLSTNSIMDKRDKQIISSYLYFHIKINKMDEVNFKLESNEFLNSINTIENEKYRKKVYKNFKYDFSSLANEYKFFENEFFQGNSKIGSLFYNYRNIILKSEYDLFDVIIKDFPIEEEKENIKNFKSLDFIFKKKDFDLEYFRNQYLEIKNNFTNHTQQKNNSFVSTTSFLQERNPLLLKLSKFLSLSYQNIYLMNYIYDNDEKLYNEIVETYKEIIKIETLSTMNVTNHHYVYTDFNVNHFLQMNQEFKEFYLKNLKDIMQYNNNTRFPSYDNLLKIFQKEPELLNIFQDAQVDESLKLKSDGYKIYFLDLKLYSKILSMYEIDNSINNSNKEIDKNIIKIDNIFIFPNLQI